MVALRAPRSFPPRCLARSSRFRTTKNVSPGIAPALPRGSGHDRLLSIPTDAPFTLDQRAWLGGFLAGMAAARRHDDETATVPTLTVDIAYGTQTGNSEELAQRLAGAVRGRGLGATVRALDDLDVAQLPATSYLLVVTSTYGEGEMPDNAELFWEALAARQRAAAGGHPVRRAVAGGQRVRGLLSGRPTDRHPAGAAGGGAGGAAGRLRRRLRGPGHGLVGRRGRAPGGRGARRGRGGAADGAGPRADDGPAGPPALDPARPVPVAAGRQPGALGRPQREGDPALRVRPGRQRHRLRGRRRPRGGAGQRRGPGRRAAGPARSGRRGRCRRRVPGRAADHRLGDPHPVAGPADRARRTGSRR